MTSKKKSVRKIALPHLQPTEKQVLLVPLNLHIPARLLQRIRACAGYWSQGDVNAWLLMVLQKAVEGDMDSMHHELSEKCEKGEA